MTTTTTGALRPQSPELGQVRLPPTPAEIATAPVFAGAYLIVFFEPLLPESIPIRRLCPCALAPSGVGCLVRTRVRRAGRGRRQRGSRHGRSPPNDDGDDGADGPPPPAHDRDAGKRS